MQGKKEKLSWVLDRLTVLSRIGRLRRNVIVVFSYHRIARSSGPPTAFADDVFGPTAESFEASLVWLKRHVRVLSEAELLAALEGGRSPGRLSVMITFDDAYRDQFDLALPILLRHQVPAVFFVPTRLIEEREIGWWDQIAWIIKKTSLDRIHAPGRSFRLPDQRLAAVTYFHRRMQLEPYETTKALVGELAESCGVELPTRDVRDRELMTWDQIREAARSGVAIGSHTHSHRVLATLDEDAQREELRRSKTMLEEKLGQPVRSLAYPVGGYRHFTGITQRLARECGYSLAYSFCTGVNHVSRLERFDVHRIGAPNAPALMAGITVLPEVFDWEQASTYGG